MRVLVTGAAGFIGFSLSRRLLEEGHEVVGLDNFDPYYDVALKEHRAKILSDFGAFTLERADMADPDAMREMFVRHGFSHVMNLAAQAGVRYSIDHPEAYVRTNLVGFSHILEGCRQTKVGHLVFASSSSVYGLNTLMPFSVHHNVDHPISLYAATKKSNELMAHSYSYLFSVPTTGLRFFTVYGPWGRPDMALFLFTKATLEGKPLRVFNYGKMRRDFTYIDDIVEGVYRVLQKVPEPNPQWSGDAPDPASSPAPYRLYNIGNNNTVELEDFICAIEEALGKKAVREYLPLQPGDVPASFADIEDLHDAVGFRPNTPIKQGISAFVDWYRNYYGV